MATFDSNFSAILALGTGGAGTLAAVLATGNSTGNTSLVVSNPNTNPNARIQGEDSAIANAGDLILRGGNSTAGDGGDVVISAGTGTGTNGSIILEGDTNITNGNFSTDLIRFGSGTPEGAVTAPVGAIYSRVDGTSGTTFYSKIAGMGNTGWIPVGPTVFEKFSSGPGQSVFNTARNFVNRTADGIEPRVFLNGIRQDSGVGNDFTITLPNIITFASPLFAGDKVLIDFLPAD